MPTLDTLFFENQPLAISGCFNRALTLGNLIRNVDAVSICPALTELELVGFEQRLLALGMPEFYLSLLG